MLLTVAELRKHLTEYPTGADADDALYRILEAAEAAITESVGSLGDVTEIIHGGSTVIILGRQASALTTVTEAYQLDPLVLDGTDYQLSPGGYLLDRLGTGTNPRYSWWGPVQVVYTPRSDVALRESVAVALCQQFVNLHPGLSAETIGSWSQAFANNNAWNWALERDAILATLHPTPQMHVL